MIYEGLRIKTPSVAYMKKYKTNEGEDIWSFFYNYGKKNKETGEYEILERYTIFIKNIVPKEDCEVICTKIVSVKPVVKTSKDGREFLQCEVTIEADNVANPKLSRYRDNANNTSTNNYQEREEHQYSNNNNSSNSNNNGNFDYIDDSSLPF